MTVQTDTNSIAYVGNGSTVHFDYDFLILDASHLKVYFGDVLQTSGYVVSGVLSQTGGTVAFAVAPPNGTAITLTRSVPFLQLTDYQPYDAFPAESHERALDLLTMMAQQLKDSVDRSMQHPVGGDKWDAKGNEIINAGEGLSDSSVPNVVQTKALITALAGPDSSAQLRDDIVNGEFNEKLGSRYSSVSSAVSDIGLKVGDRVIVDNYHLNGNSGILFFNVVATGTGVVDGGKYINTANGLQLKQNLRLPMSPSAWGAKADGTDDSPSINAMISYFKSTLPAPPANKNYDAKGKGLDFSGRTYSLAATADFSGIDNLSVYNPSFVAIAGFVGTELAKFASLDPTWYVENTTLWNPYFDCAWIADYGFDAADFLNLKVMGGKLTHYRKKGFRTRRINVGPHEINMVGTFIFQREYNEAFPVDITEGEGFEVGNYDNNFTNVVIGYQKKWTGTLASGANMFSNCHFYSGVESWPESGLRSLDTADDFDGCYFDSVPLFLRNRSSISDCYFVIEETKDFAIELTTLDPYRIKITGSRFRKLAGASVQAIKMKTIAEGRITRPDIYDNTADGCTVLQTRGAHPVNISATSTTFALPDQYQPLSSLGPVYLAAGADGLFQERMFGQAYNSTTKQITVNCYAVSGGSMAGSNLGGKQALINFNQ